MRKWVGGGGGERNEGLVIRRGGEINEVDRGCELTRNMINDVTKYD